MPPLRRSGDGPRATALAQLLFDELDVLAHLRIVLLHAQLFAGGLLVLRGGVEVTRPGRRNQLDLVAHLATPRLTSRLACDDES